MTKAKALMMLSSAPDSIWENAYYYGEVWAGGSASGRGISINYDRCEALRAVHASGIADGVKGWFADGRWSESDRGRDNSGRGVLDGWDQSHGRFYYDEGGRADTDSMGFAPWI